MLIEKENVEIMNKYPGIIKQYADELFSKNIGENIRIPFSVLSSMLEDQKGGPRDITRRAFSAYIENRFKVKRAHADRPSLMSKLLDF